MQKVMSLFKRKKKIIAAQYEKKDQLNELMQRFKVFDTLQNNGYIYLDQKLKRVLISDDLAVIYLVSSVRWSRFLDNLYRWFSYTLSQQAWQRRFKDAELNALREARRSSAALSARQEREVRQRARLDVDVQSEPLPAFPDYEFVIAHGMLTDASATATVVGRYACGSFDMVSFEQLSSLKP